MAGTHEIQFNIKQIIFLRMYYYPLNFLSAFCTCTHEFERLKYVNSDVVIGETLQCNYMYSSFLTRN